MSMFLGVWRILGPGLVGFSGSNVVVAWIQAAGAGNELVNSADRLTLAGALVVAVAVLWRALTKKDDLVVSATKTVTEALSASAESNRQLQHIIEASVRTKEELKEAVDELRMSLRVLPCVEREAHEQQQLPRTRKNSGS